MNKKYVLVLSNLSKLTGRSSKYFKKTFSFKG